MIWISKGLLFLTLFTIGLSGNNNNDVIQKKEREESVITGTSPTSSKAAPYAIPVFILVGGVFVIVGILIYRSRDAWSLKNQDINSSEHGKIVNSNDNKNAPILYAPSPRRPAPIIYIEPSENID